MPCRRCSVNALKPDISFVLAAAFFILISRFIRCLKSLLCVVSPRRLQSEPRCSGETPQTHQRPAGTPWDPPARSLTGEYPPATQGSPHQPSGISGHNHGDGAMQRAPDPARRPRHAAGDGLERLWRARHEGHQAVRSQPRAGRWQQGLPPARGRWTGANGCARAQTRATERGRAHTRVNEGERE